MNITQKQLSVLAFLRDYQQRNGYSASSRDIQEHFGFSSQTAAMNYLKALRGKGLIRTTPGVSRSIVLL